MWRFWPAGPQVVVRRRRNTDHWPVHPNGRSACVPPTLWRVQRHDIWLNFSPELPAPATMVALGRLADEPRGCSTAVGSVKVVAPLNRWTLSAVQRSGVDAWIGQAYDGVTSTSVGNNHWGLRNFGDFPYTPPMWRNGYYARILGAIHWGVASGDQRWLERSFEMARHIADVDTVHIRPGHADWAECDGMTCALGEDHSQSQWQRALGLRSMATTNSSALLLTGCDPDSRTDAMAGAGLLVAADARCRFTWCARGHTPAALPNACL